MSDPHLIVMAATGGSVLGSVLTWVLMTCLEIVTAHREMP